MYILLHIYISNRYMCMYIYTHPCDYIIYVCTSKLARYLENELAMFTSKMLEMRTAAEALQEEIQVARPGTSPTSAASSVATSLPSFSNQSEVVELLKKALRKEEPELKQLSKELRREVRGGGEEGAYGYHAIHIYSILYRCACYIHCIHTHI